MTLRWQGEEVKRRMRAAQRQGINETMAASVIHAKRNHTWRNRTGTLEGSIAIVSSARDTTTGAEGRWGSQDVRYALIHELGGVITPKAAKALLIRDERGNIVASVQQVTIPPRPYLRPAAAVEYPKLTSRIRNALGE